MGELLAIDFGTSNTVVAAWNPATEQAETLRLLGASITPTPEIPALIPSLLYVADAAIPAVKVGETVRQAGLDQVRDGRYFAGFKRAIAADVTGFSPTLDGVELSPHQAGSLFLEALLHDVRAGGRSIDSLVCTVPVQSFERYLSWLQGLAARLAIPNLRIVDESTAAALGYEALLPGSPVLVVDFGGGTLDISLVRTPQARTAGLDLNGEEGHALLRDSVATVIAKGGQVIGGEDIDHWLLDDFLKRHNRRREDVAADLLQLKALVERAKIRLSSESSAEIAFFDSELPKTLKTVYDRGAFEDLLEDHDFFVKIQSTLDGVLRQAEAKGVTRDAIAQVLLVGGTTLIPAVQRAVRQNFSREKVKAHKPFEAVAHGAVALLTGIEVSDFLHHGYGIRYWDVRSQRHQYEPIFPPGQVYPTPAPVELVLRASRRDQPAIELVIGEVEPAQPGASEVVFEGDRLVTTAASPSGRVVPLNDREGAKTIAKLEPPGTPGEDRIRVQFSVDARRRLRVTVTDLQTQACLLDDEAVADLR